MEHSHDTEQLNKWRLMLGRYADNQIPFGAGSKTMQDMDNVLDYLYSREYGEDEGVRDPKELRGGSGQSQLTVSKWINEVNRLFPKETIEVLEKEALDRYGMTELFTKALPAGSTRTRRAPSHRRGIWT